MADFSTPFALNGGRRLPTSDERAQGFPCGPADQTLFNGLFNRIEAELGAVISYAGLTPTDSQFNQLRQAISAMINSATGGGETDDYLLKSQATSLFPFFPEVQSNGGVINVTSPGVGTVRLPGGVNFVHRGIDVITTAETDFATTMSRTYHLRWDPVNGFRLLDLLNATYNPSGLPEDDAAFDTTYDDMLIARVISNSSNVVSITNLVNKSKLSVNQVIVGTDPLLVNQNGSNHKIEFFYNWARRPSVYSLDLWKRSGTAETDWDITFAPINASPRNADVLNSIDAGISLNRYRVGSIVMVDYTSSITTKFSGGA